MLKQICFTLLLLPLFAFKGDNYLDKISLYQQDSSFKQKVYEENDWKSFSKMKEAQSVVNPSSYDLHLLNAAVFFATNKMRESKRTKALRFSAELRDAATVHTNQMVEKNFFDHFNHFTPALRTPEQRIKLFGVINTAAMAENVDYTFIELKANTTYWQLAEKIAQDFYDSPPHRKNMLNKEFTRLGCAAMFEAKDKNGARYVKCTQDFSAEY